MASSVTATAPKGGRSATGRGAHYHQEMDESSQTEHAQGRCEPAAADRSPCEYIFPTSRGNRSAYPGVAERKRHCRGERRRSNFGKYENDPVVWRRHEHPASNVYGFASEVAMRSANLWDSPVPLWHTPAHRDNCTLL